MLKTGLTAAVCLGIALACGDPASAKIVTQDVEYRDGNTVLQGYPAYDDAVHRFTNPAAGDNPASGRAYNAEVDRRSWGALQLFFNELFGR